MEPPCPNETLQKMRGDLQESAITETAAPVGTPNTQQSDAAAGVASPIYPPNSMGNSAATIAQANVAGQPGLRRPRHETLSAAACSEDDGEQEDSESPGRKRARLSPGATEVEAAPSTMDEGAPREPEVQAHLQGAEQAFTATSSPSVDAVELRNNFFSIADVLEAALETLLLPELESLGAYYVDPEASGSLRPELLQSLGAYYFDPEASGSTGRTCADCQHHFEAQELVVGLPCGHEFHAWCVCRFVVDDHTCPLCREDDSGEQL